jgi:hypothetical protein
MRVIFAMGGWTSPDEDPEEADTSCGPWKCLGRQAEVFAVRWDIAARDNLGNAFDTASKSKAWDTAKNDIVARSSKLEEAVDEYLGLPFYDQTGVRRLSNSEETNTWFRSASDGGSLSDRVFSPTPPPHGGPTAQAVPDTTQNGAAAHAAGSPHEDLITFSEPSTQQDLIGFEAMSTHQDLIDISEPPTEGNLIDFGETPTQEASTAQQVSLPNPLLTASAVATPQVGPTTSAVTTPQVGPTTLAVPAPQGGPVFAEVVTTQDGEQDQRPLPSNIAARQFIVAKLHLQATVSRQPTRSILMYSAVLGTLHGCHWPLSLLRISKLLDNPWHICIVRAEKAGYCLAEAIARRVQGNRPVSLVGYSLGARAIYTCLMTLAERRQLNLVDSAVLIGAPAPSESRVWSTLKSVVSGRLINVYSETDYLLAFLYRTSNVQFGLAGLQAVRAEGVENYDVGDLCSVGGHTRYRHMVGTIMRDIGWDDVDHGEVQRSATALAAFDAQYKGSPGSAPAVVKHGKAVLPRTHKTLELRAANNAAAHMHRPPVVPAARPAQPLATQTASAPTAPAGPRVAQAPHHAPTGPRNGPLDNGQRPPTGPRSGTGPSNSSNSSGPRNMGPAQNGRPAQNGPQACAGPRDLPIRPATRGPANAAAENAPRGRPEPARPVASAKPTAAVLGASRQPLTLAPTANTAWAAQPASATDAQSVSVAASGTSSMDMNVSADNEPQKRRRRRGRRGQGGGGQGKSTVQA